MSALLRLFSLSSFVELDQRPLILQSIGVYCNAPVEDLLSCQLYVVLFRSLFSCELDQRPLLLQSIDVNCNAQDLGCILLVSALLRLFSFTLSMGA